jgi:hypothetical protein
MQNLDSFFRPCTDLEYDTQIRQQAAASTIRNKRDREQKEEADRQRRLKQQRADMQRRCREEDDDISDADALQVEDEENNSDLATDLQDDEDDATVEEALAAAIEDRLLVGVRRSARLQGNDIMRSYHVATQLQNQILNCIEHVEQ